jgi:3'-phosphoadenosine 5'-phosphosulfate sulfotransferase (PAPS reductase)/FAD synthetase
VSAESEIKAAALYAKMPEHNALVNRTRGFIRWALERVKNPYLACSFGKDSAAMLHLVLQYAPRIPVVWVTFPETRLLDNYQDVVDEWNSRYNLNLYEVFVDVAPEIDFDDKKAFPLSYDGYFVGIRKDESLARRISLRKYGSFYQKKNGLFRIAPMADWATNDIAAYCVANEIPTLDVYKKETFAARSVTSITEDLYGFRQNQLSELKRRNINAYTKLLHDYPALRKYV